MRARNAKSVEASSRMTFPNWHIHIENNLLFPRFQKAAVRAQ
jgi:iron-sulfur cluster repair protein YtfE (RIC family)